jgi:protein involved in polysaccharide export with SLBB domain
MTKHFLLFIFVATCSIILNAQYIPSASEIEQIKKRLEEAQQVKDIRIPQQLPKSGLETFPEPKGMNIPATKYVNIDSVLSYSIENRQPFEYLEVFGTKFFRNFSTNLAAESFGPVDDNYIFGVGDEVIITIWGEVNKRFETVINRNGQIYLEEIGNISLAGKKFGESVASMKRRLAKYYSSLSRNKAYLDISLGKIRSVRVFIAGQVKKPGIFNVTADASVLDLLGLVNGPNDVGSMRNIYIMSQDKLRKSMDLYPFFTSGNIQNTEIRLLNNDIIFVQPMGNRVYLDGAINIPAIYELKNDETIEDLISFAGGFREDAYRTNISITRINENYEQKILNIDFDVSSSFNLKNGDKVYVHQVQKETRNYVQVNGPIFGPSIFGYEKGMTLLTLFSKIDSVSADANLERVEITRTDERENKSVFSVNLAAIFSGENSDISLKQSDVIIFYRKNELNRKGFVSIIGAVQKPGKYEFANNISVNSLIHMAGGYTDNAWVDEAEISRLQINQQTDTDTLAQLFYVGIDKDIAIQSPANQFILQPYDIVHIRENSNWELQRIVTIKGQVRFPGVYTVQNKNEKISDLIKRAGGLKESAFVQGAFFLRQFEDYGREERRIFQAFSDTSANALQSSTNISAMLLPKNIPSLQYELLDDSTRLAEKALLLEEVLPANIRERKKYGIIGIDFEEVLDDRDSEQNIVLRDKDVIIIPEQKNTVRVIGAVYNPSNVLYRKGASINDYLTLAGGTLADAEESKIFVQLANGKIVRESSFLFYNYLSSEITPGSTIYVPKELPQDRINWPATIRDVASILGSIATAILIINNIK